MSDTEQILDRFRESQGWTDKTILDLALTYIENQSSPEAWEDYLTSLAEVDNDIDHVGDIPERIRSSCGCGHDIVWTGEGWQHDVAPYFHGDDHDIDTEEPDQDDPARVYWDTVDGVRFE